MTPFTEAADSRRPVATALGGVGARLRTVVRLAGCEPLGGRQPTPHDGEMWWLWVAPPAEYGVLVVDGL